MAEALTPTERLLLRLARCELSAVDGAAVAALAPGVDWAELARLARRGEVAGLVARHLDGFELPGEAKRELLTAAVTAEAANRRLLEAAWTLCQRAERRGLTLVPIKGAALNLGLPYDDPGMRGQCDIDLWARREEVEDVGVLLADADFVEREDLRPQLLRYSHHLTFIRAPKSTRDGGTGPQMIELHWTPFFVWYTRPELEAAALGRTRLHLHEGRAVRVLDPADMLLSVTLHLAVHRYRTRLKWLVDVAELGRRFGAEIDWGDFWQRARALDATRAVAYAFALARELLDAPLPGPPGRQFLLPLVRALSPPHELVRSEAQPPEARRLLIDLLQRDSLGGALKNAWHKGAELWERAGLPRVPARLSRRQPLPPSD